MTSDDARIRRERLSGQDVLLPTPDGWRVILAERGLDGLALPDWVVRWLAAHSDLAAVSLGLVRLECGWVPVQFLRLAGRTLRIHVEDVICEHCGRRCGPSATPDPDGYAGSGYSGEQVWAEFSGLPVRACPHCGGVLRRRQTVWLAPQEAEPGAAPDPALKAGPGR